MRERIRTGPFLETLAVGVLPRIGAMGEMGKIGGAVAVGAKPRLSRRKCRFNFIHLSLECLALRGSRTSSARQRPDEVAKRIVQQTRGGATRHPK